MLEAGAHRLVSLHERETRFFPRSELFDSRGRSRILPETRALKAIELRDVADGMQLRVLGLIGHLPLTSEITLNLRPKFPTDNLWFMLENGEEAYEAMLPVLRSYENAPQNAPHQLLARSFCYYLHKIMASGLARRYEPRRHQGYFRPKVDFGDTISKFVARGNEISAASRVFAFSAHTQLNSQLKTACIRFLRILPLSSEWEDDRTLLLAALAALTHTPVREPTAHLLALADDAPSRVREAYVGALTVYSIMLGHTSIGFAYDPSGASMPSFLFCLDDVFEQFVRNILRQGLRPFKIGVADGNRPGNQMRLFRDNARYPVKPDLIFRRERRAVAAGEVKYKQRIDEVDRYQLISHTLALDVPIAAWISPAASAADEGLQYIGLIAEAHRFYHYQIHIGSNLRVAADRMCEQILGLLASQNVVAAA